MWFGSYFLKTGLKGYSHLGNLLIGGGLKDPKKCPQMSNATVLCMRGLAAFTSLGFQWEPSSSRNERRAANAWLSSLFYDFSWSAGVPEVRPPLISKFSPILWNGDNLPTQEYPLKEKHIKKYYCSGAIFTQLNLYCFDVLHRWWWPTAMIP